MVCFAEIPDISRNRCFAISILFEFAALYTKFPKCVQWSSNRMRWLTSSQLSSVETLDQPYFQYFYHFINWTVTRNDYVKT